MKVNDIRPLSLMGSQATAMKADIDWLLDHEDSFVEVGCPACGSNSKTTVYRKYDMRHVVCKDCSTQYISPRPTPEILSEFYQRSENYKYWASHIFPGSETARRNKIFKPRAKIIKKYIENRRMESDFLLEVGAAHGIFCEEVRKFKMFRRIVAVEPHVELAQRCRDLGLETFGSSYENIQIDEKISVIASFEVIEHLYHPIEFIQWCRESLSENGHLLLTCPNISGFDTSIMGVLSDSVDHEHLNLFTPKSLSLLLEKNGFCIEELTTPGELDVDIVREALETNILSPDQLGGYLTNIIMSSNEAVKDKFQEFLRASQLSSNMMVLGRKL